jgi:hypothetical protein
MSEKHELSNYVSIKKAKSKEVEEKFNSIQDYEKVSLHKKKFLFQSLSSQNDDIHKERDFYDFKWVLLFASIK